MKHDYSLYFTSLYKEKQREPRPGDTFKYRSILDDDDLNARRGKARYPLRLRFRILLWKLIGYPPDFAYLKASNRRRYRNTPNRRCIQESLAEQNEPTVIASYEKYEECEAEIHLEEESGVFYMSKEPTVFATQSEYARCLEFFGLRGEVEIREIRQAYRKALKRHHPDTSPEANHCSPEVLTNIMENYQRLCELHEQRSCQHPQ